LSLDLKNEYSNLLNEENVIIIRKDKDLINKFNQEFNILDQSIYMSLNNINLNKLLKEEALYNSNNIKQIQTDIIVDRCIKKYEKNKK
jgi:hypothetical protein